jgi:outer membrane biosynthesis protein TonB
MTFEKTLFFSLFLHIVLLISLTLSFGKKYPVPDVYEVDLIMPGSATDTAKKEESAVENKEEPAAEVKAPPAPVKQEKPRQEKQTTVGPVESVKKETAPDWRKEKEERLLAMGAKEKIKQRVRLRDTLNIGEDISSKGKDKGATKSPPLEGNPQGSPEGDPVLGEYIAGYKARVQQNYLFSDMRSQGLMAIVNVIFLKDGRVILKDFERKSGNVFFDKAVTHAIEKAGWYKPPPYEFELGIRFSSE